MPRGISKRRLEHAYVLILSQAERKFEERDNFGARKEYRSCCTWCIGPAVWITVILPIVLTAVILVVVFAAVGII